MPMRAPMMLRTSNAPALWGAAALSEVPDVSDMVAPFSEGGVEDDDHHERDAGERDRTAVPRVGRLLRIDAVLPRRLGVDQALQLGRGLGLRHQGDADAEDEVHDEGRGRGEEGRALARQVDDTGGGQ